MYTLTEYHQHVYLMQRTWQFDELLFSFDLSSLFYQEMCFRLYPSVTMNCRILSEDIVLGGYLIPKEVKKIL